VVIVDSIQKTIENAPHKFYMSPSYMSDISAKSLGRTIEHMVINPMFGVACTLLVFTWFITPNSGTTAVWMTSYALFTMMAIMLAASHRELLTQHWMNFIPYAGIVATTITILVLLGIYYAQISRNGVAPPFYTYFGIATLGTSLSLGTLMHMSPSNNKENTALLWNLALLLITLTAGSSIVLNIILSCYSTQG